MNTHSTTMEIGGFNIGLTSDIEKDVWKKIHDIDLTHTHKKLVIDRGWSEEETRLAVNAYRVFLFLSYCARNEGKKIIPFKSVDHVWHTHILQSIKKYTADVAETIGFLLDHISRLPNESSSENAILMGDFLKQSYAPMMAHDTEYAECDGHETCEFGD